MKEDICSIPINEVFEVKDGCPVCRMTALLEQNAVEFVMGAAMMEPDIRKETNHAGFCPRHFDRMLRQKNRLSIALMLESHLETIDKKVFEGGGLFSGAGKKTDRAQEILDDCYVCSRIDSQLGHLMSTFFVLWKKEAEFRANVAAQPTLCLPHYAMLMRSGAAALDRKNFAAFSDVIGKVARAGLATLREDVSNYCKMFDYRSNGADFGSSRDSIERSVMYLTGRNKLD